MTYENFTIKAQDAILKAQEIAANLSQQVVEAVHLCKGVIETDEKLADFLFQKMGANTQKIKFELDTAIRTTPKIQGSDKQYLSGEANQVLITAKRLMEEFGDEFITLELILMAFLKNNDAVAKILKANQVTLEGLKSAVMELRKGKKVTEASGDEQFNALNKESSSS